MADFCKGADQRQYDTSPQTANVLFSLGQRGCFTAERVEPLPLSDLLARSFWNQIPPHPRPIEESKGGYLLMLPYRNLSRAAEDWLNQGWAFRVEQVQKFTPPPSLASAPKQQLRALTSTAAYLAKAQRVLDDIRAGRYYQLNLCRYFSFATAVSKEMMWQYIAQSQEPYRCYIENTIMNKVVASLSPEQFIQISPNFNEVNAPHWEIRSSPIKGTAARSADPRLDEENRNQLSQSAKDLAELAMILDLMRHDLLKVCHDRSVKVEERGRIHSFSTVHHLVGSLAGRLREGLSLGELLRALCPSGSITGAPKKEVCQAIQELEERERQFFMGNLFYISDSGWLDSSVLIRTAMGEGSSQRWHFAAGSGITLKSQINQELSEITTKTRCFGALEDS